MKKLMTVTAAVFLVWTGIGHADTLSGQIKDIDTAGNAMTIVQERSDSQTPNEYKVVWDENNAEALKLESAHRGERIVVNAEQNPVTRNWKVISVGGPAATAEKAILRTNDRTLSGQIQTIDVSNRSLVLVSSDKDEAGQAISYNVVWDAENSAVREKLEKAGVGDHITLIADKNVVSQNWKAKSLEGPLEAMGASQVHLLSGEVKQIEPAKHSLILNTLDENGKTVERKLVWDDDFQQQAKLVNAKIGDQLRVHADQNMVTRNWKIKAIA